MKLAERIFKRNDYYITSPFGMRISPISKTQKMHTGCDYGTNLEKWEQYGLEDGYVNDVVFNHWSYGNYVWVRYPRLNISLFHAHLDKINVKKGDKVTHDTIIGYTGMSGQATGIHLHLGLQYIDKDDWLDPEKYDYIEEGKSMKFKINDEVIINGELFVSPTATKSSGKVTNKTTRITRIAEGTPHPYNTTGDLGWMNEEDIKFVVEPVTDYKELYEKQLLVNKDLQAQLEVANKKIADAINILN